MVLKRENHRVFRSDKSTVANGEYHIFEQYVSAHGFAVSDDRLFVHSAVPTVQLNAATPGQQHLPVPEGRQWS